MLADKPPSIITPELIADAYGVEARIAQVDEHTVVLPRRNR